MQASHYALMKVTCDGNIVNSLTSKRSNKYEWRLGKDEYVDRYFQQPQRNTSLLDVLLAIRLPHSLQALYQRPYRMLRRRSYRHTLRGLES